MHDQDTVRIPLYARDGSIRGYVVIDADDAEAAGPFRWRLSSHGYACRNVKSRETKACTTIYLHRVLTGTTDSGLSVDHINRDRLDCRRANMRVLPRLANAQNRASSRGSSSQYRGVHWDNHSRKWQAAVRVNGHKVDLGGFDSEDAAGGAAQDARRRLLTYAPD